MLMSACKNACVYQVDYGKVFMSWKLKNNITEWWPNNESILHLMFQRMCLCWRIRMEKIQKSLASSAQQGERRRRSRYTVTILSSIKSLIKFSFAVRCLKAMQCVSIAWRTSEQHLMVHLPTERDLSITGRLMRTESPILDLDLWVLSLKEEMFTGFHSWMCHNIMHSQHSPLVCVYNRHPSTGTMFRPRRTALVSVSTVVAASAGHEGTVWARLQHVSFFSTLHKRPMQLMSLFCLCLCFFLHSLYLCHHLFKCASKVNGGGFSSSKEFPDEVLRFVRSHPVMYHPVLPQHHRPVLLQTEPGRRKLTQIAVDRVQAQDGHYHVLYIGTGTCTGKKMNPFIMLDSEYYAGPCKIDVKHSHTVIF